MRILGICTVLCTVAPGLARADVTAPELQARGEALAKDGRYTEAIDAFKAADKLEPRASHACLIALAYTRRELWPQAEIFLEKCHARSTPVDPMPEWVPQADEQIQQRLAEANVAPIEIKVDPADAPVQLTVSSFPPDESFSPRTIHLPPGHHVILAKARGYDDAQHSIDVTDKTPQQITIKLVRKLVAPGPTVDHGKRGMPTLAKWGGIVIGAGVVSYAVMGYSYFQLKKDLPAYQKYSSTYDVTRISTLALWTIGVALVVRGYTGRSSEEANVAIVPTSGGGTVSVGWQR